MARTSSGSTVAVEASGGTTRRRRGGWLAWLATVAVAAGSVPARAVISVPNGAVEAIPNDGTCSLKEALREVIGRNGFKRPSSMQAAALTSANYSTDTLDLNSGTLWSDDSSDCDANITFEGAPLGNNGATVLAFVIELAVGGVYELTAPDNNFWGPTGLPPIAAPIIIKGRGATIRRSPTAVPFRLLTVLAGQSVELHPFCVSGQTCAGALQLLDVVLEGGLAQGGRGGSGVFAGGGGAGMGGAIFNRGTVVVEGSTLRTNSAVGGMGGNRNVANPSPVGIYCGGAGGGGMGADGGPGGVDTADPRAGGGGGWGGAGGTGKTDGTIGGGGGGLDGGPSGCIETWGGGGWLRRVTGRVELWPAAGGWDFDFDGDVDCVAPGGGGGLGAGAYAVVPPFNTLTTAQPGRWGGGGGGGDSGSRGGQGGVGGGGGASTALGSGSDFGGAGGPGGGGGGARGECGLPLAGTWGSTGGKGGFGGGGGGGPDRGGNSLVGGGGGAGYLNAGFDESGLGGLGTKTATGGSGGGGGGAGLGGAIFNYAGTLTVRNSTLTTNYAQGGSGGGNSFNGLGTTGGPGLGLGSGIFQHNGTVKILDSTINDGVHIWEPVTPAGVNVVSIQRSIVSICEKVDRAAPPTIDFSAVGIAGGCSGAVAAGQGNPVQGVVPLGPFLRYGGPETTPVFSIYRGGPAFNAAGDQCAAQGSPIDQRGRPRPALGSPAQCDIGAFEVQPVSDVLLLGVTGPTLLSKQATGTFVVTVRNEFGDPVRNIRVQLSTSPVASFGTLPAGCGAPSGGVVTCTLATSLAGLAEGADAAVSIPVVAPAGATTLQLSASVTGHDNDEVDTNDWGPQSATTTVDSVDPDLTIEGPAGPGRLVTVGETFGLRGAASDGGWAGAGVSRVRWVNSTTATSGDAIGPSGAANVAWLAPGIPLALGDNSISVTATDTAGNSRVALMVVTRLAPEAIVAAFDVNGVQVLPSSFAIGRVLTQSPSNLTLTLGAAADTRPLDVLDVQLRLNGAVFATGPAAGGTFSSQLDVSGLPAYPFVLPPDPPGYRVQVAVRLVSGELVEWTSSLTLTIDPSIGSPPIAGEAAQSLWQAVGNLSPAPPLAADESIVDVSVDGDPLAGGRLWVVSSTPLRTATSALASVLGPGAELRYPAEIRSTADASRLHRFENGSWTSWDASGLGLAGRVLTAVAHDGSDLWIGTNQGLEQRAANNPAAAGSSFVGANGPAGSWVTALSIDELGDLWVAHRGTAYYTLQPNADTRYWTDAAGVSRFDGSSWARYRSVHGADQHTVPGGEWIEVAGLEVSDVDTLPGEVWVASNVGLSVLDRVSGTWSYHTKAEGLPFVPVGSLAVASVAVGAETQTWAWVGGTQGAGFLRARPNGEATWSSYGPLLRNLDPINSGAVRDLSIDAAAGLVWVSTAGGLASFEPGRQRWRAHAALDEAGLGAGQELSDGSSAPVWSAVRDAAGQVRFATADFSLGTALLAPADGVRLGTGGLGRVAVPMSWQAVDDALGYEIYLDGRFVARTAGAAATLTLGPGDYDWTVRAVFAGGSAGPKAFPRGLTVLDDTGSLDALLLGEDANPATLTVQDHYWPLVSGSSTASSITAFREDSPPGSPKSIFEGYDLAADAAGRLAAVVWEPGPAIDLRGHWAGLSVPGQALGTDTRARAAATGEADGFLLGAVPSGRLWLWDGSSLDSPTVSGGAWQVPGLLDVAGLDGNRFAVLIDAGGTNPDRVAVYEREGKSDNTLEIIATGIDLGNHAAVAVAGRPGGGFAVLTPLLVQVWDYDPAGQRYVLGSLLAPPWTVGSASMRDLAVDPQGRILVTWEEAGQLRLAVLLDVGPRGGSAPTPVSGTVAILDVSGLGPVATLWRPSARTSQPPIPYLPPPGLLPDEPGYVSCAAGGLTVLTAAPPPFPGCLGGPFTTGTPPANQPTFIEYFLSTDGAVEFTGSNITGASSPLYLDFDTNDFPGFAGIFSSRVEIAAAGWSIDTTTGAITGTLSTITNFQGVADLVPSSLAVLGRSLYPEVSKSGIAMTGTMPLPIAGGITLTGHFDHLFLADFGGEFVATFGEDGLAGLIGETNERARFWFHVDDGADHLAFPVQFVTEGRAGVEPGNPAFFRFERVASEICAGEDSEDLYTQFVALNCNGVFTMEVSNLDIGRAGVTLEEATAELYEAFSLEIRGAQLGQDPANPGFFGIGAQGTAEDPAILLTVGEDETEIPGFYLGFDALRFDGDIPVQLGPVDANLNGLGLRWQSSGNEEPNFSLAALDVTIGPEDSGREFLLHLEDLVVPFSFFEDPPAAFPTASQVVVRLRDTCEENLATEPAGVCSCVPCGGTSCDVDWSQDGKSEKEYFRIAICDTNGLEITDERITIPAFDLLIPVEDGAGERERIQFGGATIAEDYIELHDPTPVSLFGAEFDFEEVRLGRLEVDPGDPEETGFQAAMASVAIAGDSQTQNSGPALAVELQNFRLSRVATNPAEFRLGLTGGRFQRYGFAIGIKKFDFDDPVCEPWGIDLEESDPAFDLELSGLPIIGRLTGAAWLDHRQPELDIICLNPPRRVQVGPLTIEDIVFGDLPQPPPEWAVGNINGLRWADPAVYGGKFTWGKVGPVGAYVVLENGSLDMVRGDYEFPAPGKPVGPSVYLQRLEGELRIKDMSLWGSAEFSGGPQVSMPMMGGRKLFFFYVDSDVLLSSAGYMRATAGLSMLRAKGIFDGFPLAQAELTLGRIFRGGSYLGEGVYFTGNANLLFDVLSIRAVAWMYFENPVIFAGRLDGSLRVPGFVPIIGGESFGGVNVAVSGTVPLNTSQSPRLTFRGKVYIGPDCCEIGVAFKIDSQDGFSVFRRAGEVGPQLGPSGTEGSDLQVFTDFARLTTERVTLGNQITASRVFSFEVTEDVPVAVVRLDYSEVSSGDVDMSIRFPDGTVHTPVSAPAMFPPDPNAPPLAAGDVLIVHGKNDFAGAPAVPDGPAAQPALHEAVYLFTGPLAWQPVPVNGPDGAPTAETVDRLRPTPVLRGIYQVTVTTSGVGDPRDATFEVLLGNNPPSFESLTAAELGAGQTQVDWTVADADRDPVTVTLRLAVDRAQPANGFAVGELEGWVQEAADLTRSVTVATCDPAIRARGITAPLHLFAGIEDGREQVAYRYLRSYEPCLQEGTPPPVQDVVMAAGDGVIDAYWTPLRWEPPAGTRLSSYAINAVPLGPPGTVGELPVTTGVPIAQRSSDELPTAATGDDWIVTEVHASPDPVLGDANGDGTAGGDRFLELYNDSGQGQDVSGWLLSVNGGSALALPAGTYVPDRCALLLFESAGFEGGFGSAVVRSLPGLAIAPGAGGLTLTATGGGGSWSAAWPAVINQSATLVAGTSGPFVPHTQAEGAALAAYSPGSPSGGGSYLGCAALGQGRVEGLTNGREYQVTVTPIAERRVPTTQPICPCYLRQVVVESGDTSNYCHPQFALPAAGTPVNPSDPACAQDDPDAPPFRSACIDTRQYAIDRLPFDHVANPLPLACDTLPLARIYDQDGNQTGIGPATEVQEIAGPPSPAVTVKVGAAGANNAPRIVSTPTRVVEVGAGNVWTYRLRALDDDGNALKLLVDVAGDPTLGLSKTKLPVALVVRRASDGVEIGRTNPGTTPVLYLADDVGGSWLLQVVPGSDPAVVGRYAITLTVADSVDLAPGGPEPPAGTADRQTLYLEVVHFGQTPNEAVISSQAPRVATVGEQYRYDLEVESSQLGFEPGLFLRQGPPGMTMDSSTGIVTWMPTAADVATSPHLVVLEVFDPEGDCSVDCLLASESFALEVQMNPLVGIAGVAVLSVLPPLASVAGPGGTVNVTLANLGPAGTSINYQMTPSDAGMLSIASGASGTIGATAVTVPVTVAANPAAHASRSGSLLVSSNAGPSTVVGGPQQVDVIQAENPEQVISLSPAALSIVKGGGNVGVGVTNSNPSPGPMEWTATVISGVAYASLSMEAQSGQSVTFTNTAGETKTFQVVFAENFVGPRSATIRVTSIDASNSPQDVVIAQDGNSADLSITKEADVAVVELDDFVTYTISVTNNDPANTAVGVRVIDSLPAQLTFSATLPVSGFLPGCAEGGAGFDTCTLGTIPPGATRKYRLVARADLVATVTNLATVYSDTPDPNSNNDIAQRETTIASGVGDLGISKDDGVTTMIPGRRTAYTIVVTNDGPSTVVGAKVEDPLPSGIAEAVWESRVLAGTVSGNTPSGVGGLDETLTLSSGAVLEYTVNALVDPAALDELVNTATIVVPPAATDPDSGNNQATDSDSLEPMGNVAIDKDDAQTEAVPGETITYTVTVTNHNVPGTLYFSRDGSGSGLYRLDRTTAAATPAGLSGVTGSTVGLAPSLDNETLFGSRPSGLLHVRTDGSGATVHGAVQSEGLGFDPSTNTLYRSNGATFGTMNPNTGAAIATLTSPTPILTVAPDIEGLDFGAGVVFALLRGERQLFVYDPGLGTWSTRGDTGILWQSAALAYDRQQQVLYAKRQGNANLYRIDPANGATTVVGQVIAPIIGPILDGGGLAFVDPPAYSHATGVLVEDDFPAALVNPSWTCTGSPGFACSPGSGDPMSTLATVPADGEVVYTITALIDPSVRGTLSNTATAEPPATFTDVDTNNHDDGDVDTLTPKVNLRLTKSESADPVAAGSGTGNLTHVVTLENLGPSTANGIVINEVITVPLGVTIDSITPSAGTWNGSQWSVPVMLPGVSHTLTVVYTVGLTAPDGSFVTDTATVASVIEPLILTTDDTVTESTRVEWQADLEVTKTESGDPVIAGSGANNLTHVVTVKNLGPSNATSVAVTESLTLPPGVTLSSVTPSLGSYAAPTWTVGNLAPGASGTLTVVVTAGAATADGATVADTATVVEPTAQVDPQSGNNQATESTTVERRVDLAVSKTESIDPVIVGSGPGNLTYVVTVINHGPSNASGVSVSEALTLPSDVTVDSVTPSAGSWADPTWTVGNLEVAASATLTVVLTVGEDAPRGSDLVGDTATVAVTETDTDSGNQAITVLTSIAGETDLSLGKQDDVDPVAPGGTVHYTLTVTNHGPSSSTASQVVDQLPPELSFASSPDGCTANLQTVSCPLGPLASGASQSVEFAALAVGSATVTVTNTATVEAADIDPVDGNDLAAETTTIDASPPQVGQVELVGTLGAAVVEECGQLRSSGDRVRLTFGEAMADPPGDNTPGDVTNPASYLLVEAGADRDLASTNCAVGDDDIAVPVTSVAYEGATRTATLQLASTAVPSLYRLMACGLEDLVGNPLAGGTFDRQLRIDPANLFVNGHFDCELSPWEETPLGVVAYDVADVDDANVSGSVRLANTDGSTHLVVTQCVVPVDTTKLQITARAKADLGVGESIDLVAGCRYFALPGCNGNAIGNATAASQGVQDTAGLWIDVTLAIEPVTISGVGSASCAVGIEIPGGQFGDVFLDDVRLPAGGPLLTDGFEGGSTSAWPESAP